MACGVVAWLGPQHVEENGMRRRTLDLLAVIGASTLLLAAGGIVNAQEDATPEAQESPALSGDLRVAVWSDWQFVEAAARDYMDTHPGVSIDVQAITGQDYFDNMPRTLGTADAADVTVLQVTQTGTYRPVVEEGLLMDVSDIWRSQDLDEAIPESVVEVYTEEDGSRYSVNVGLTYLPIIYYNKEIFDELGLQVEDGSRLESYDEFYAITEALAEAGVVPMSYAWARDAHHIFQQNLHSSCGDEGYQELGSNWRPGSEPTLRWTDECAVRAIEQYAEMAERGVFGAQPVMGFDVAGATFTSGGAGMWMTGMWAIGQLRDEAEFEWGWFMAPPIPGGEETRWILWTADGLGVAANTQHPELAKDFLASLMTIEAQSQILTFGRPPARTDISVPPDADPAIVAMQESLDTLGTAVHFIQVLAPPDFQDIIQSGSEEVVLGTRSPEDLAQELEDLAESFRAGG
jgi:raffinose/stachyose/melibiose transport system substrate-binding protein